MCGNCFSFVVIVNGNEGESLLANYWLIGANISIGGDKSTVDRMHVSNWGNGVCIFGYFINKYMINKQFLLN